MKINIQQAQWVCVQVISNNDLPDAAILEIWRTLLSPDAKFDSDDANDPAVIEYDPDTMNDFLLTTPLLKKLKENKRHGR